VARISKHTMFQCLGGVELRLIAVGTQGRPGLGFGMPMLYFRSIYMKSNIIVNMYEVIINTSEYMRITLVSHLMKGIFEFLTG
jgi:hypothetical protein